MDNYFYIVYFDILPSTFDITIYFDTLRFTFDI